MYMYSPTSNFNSVPFLRNVKFYGVPASKVCAALVDIGLHVLSNFEVSHYLSLVVEFRYY